MIKSLLKDTKILKVMNSVAAGVTDPTTDIIDMQGYNGICFIAKFGVIVNAAAITLTVSQGNNNALSDAAVLTKATTGIPVASSDSEQSLVLDIVKPSKRYLQMTVTLATQNTEIDAIFAILYNPMVKPVTQPATIDAGVLVISPEEA